MAACDAASCCARRRWARLRSAIRTLSLGKPLVVSDLGWFGELPGRRRAEGAGRRRRGGRGARRGARTARRPGVGRADGRGGLALRRARSTTSTASPSIRRRARAGGRRRRRSRRSPARGRRGGCRGRRRAGAARAGARRLGLVGGTATSRCQTPRTRARSRRWPMWAWLGVARTSSRSAVQLALGLRVVAPWIMVDELVYSDMARSFARHGPLPDPRRARELRLRLPAAALARLRALRLDARTSTSGRASSTRSSMCSVVFPTYLLARRVVRPGAALAAAALAVAIPSMIYVGTLMTENAFYPSSLWLAYALVLALEQPTLRAAARPARALRARIPDARAGGRALSQRCSRRRSCSPGSSAAGRAGSARGSPLYGVVGAARVLVDRRRGRARPLAVADPRRLQRHGDARQLSRCGLRSAGSCYHVAALDLSLFVLPFAALIVLVASARHLDRRAARLRGGRGHADRLARDRGRGLRLAVVAADRGAQPLLRRAALPHRALRLDRARTAATAARGGRGRRRRGGAARRDPVSRPDEHQRAVRHAVHPAVVVPRRRARRARATSRSLAVARLSRARRGLPLASAPLRAGPARRSSRSASCSPGCRSSSGCTPSRDSRRPPTRPGSRAAPRLDRHGGRAQRGRDAHLDRRATRIAAGRTSSGTAASGASTTSARARCSRRQPRAAPDDPAVDGHPARSGRKPLRAEYVLADPTTEIVGTRDRRGRGQQMTLYRVHGPAAHRDRDRRAGTATSGQARRRLDAPRMHSEACFASRSRATRCCSPVSHSTSPSQGATAPLRREPALDRTKTISVPLRPRRGTCHVRLRRSRRRAQPPVQRSDARLLGMLVDGFEYVPSPRA